MALGKEIELLNGSTASYWRLSEIIDARKGRILFLRLEGYKTLQHRLDGKPPVVTEDYTFDDVEYPQESLNESGGIVVGYTKLKTLAKFAGATDV
jgi:hypothetical protein